MATAYMPRRVPPPSAWSSALVAALIGFGGTIALVIQAMENLGASPAQTGSSLAASCFGIAAAGAVLSLRLRMPIVLAWSTPGAALLAATTQHFSWPVVTGVFLSSGLMMVALGLVPALGRLAARIPAALASAMLAGVLLPFCLGLLKLGSVDPLMVAVLLLVFVIGRTGARLYAMLLVLVAGTVLTLLRGQVAPVAPGPVFGSLAPVMPSIDLHAVANLGVPLFLVTLVSQNLPGLVILRGAAFPVRPGPLLAGTGVATVLAAPFGAHGLNLAAITAAICVSPDADPEQARRWKVGIIYAALYLVLALLSPLLVRSFLALPPAFITALTGVALIPALFGSFETMVADRANRDPSILTFLATASGLALFGLAPAFWGLLVGFAALAVARLLRGRSAGARLGA
jgi:benzoate membrane transport protein